IPARDGAHALDREWARVRDSLDRRRGDPLDVEERNVSSIVIAYDDVFDLALKLPDRNLARDVRRLTHAAMAELAAAFPGGRPSDPVERDFVRQRTRAMRRVLDALKRATSSRQQAVMDQLKRDRAQRRAWESDIARARIAARAAEGAGPLAA